MLEFILKKGSLFTGISAGVSLFRMKHVLVPMLMIVMLGCVGNQKRGINSVGSILLIHGSAPFNENGNVPDSRAGRYQKTDFYLKLARSLETNGWNVVRYSKPGVSMEAVDFNEYRKTDIASIKAQLQVLWKLLPTDKARLVFAWSEGSIHVHLLPLAEVDGVVLLGGISTNIRDVILSQAKSKAEREKIESELANLSSLPRNQMLGLDRPVGRLIDEFKFENNWTYFAGLPRLPLLILHGDADSEVPVSEASVWEKRLPTNRVQIRMRRHGNHMYGLGSDTGAIEIADEVSSWWNGSAKITVK